ncbi:MAG TPA: preprotein translocase subunit YajC [Jatrophihabitans sp.]|nr:preprotein translocase subunit YajC [Jatrophihabitans sp.]
MTYLPFLIIVVLMIAMLAFSARARRRQAAAETERAERIAVGTDVMTTSGLHGTVVAKHDDGTVSLSIAPGVEVRWELAALRDLKDLPPQFRRAGVGTPDLSTETASDTVIGGSDVTGTQPGTVDLGKAEHRADPGR